MRKKNNPEQARKQAGIARAALTLASGTLFSRLLGFGRDLFFAFLLGAAADAFLVAFRLPNMIRRLSAEGTIGLSYGAAASRMLNAGSGGLRDFSRAVLLRLAVASFFVALLLAALADPLVVLLAPGLAEEALARCAGLLRVCAFYLPCGLVAAIACAHASALGDFRPQAWSSALFNALIIGAGLAALYLLDPGDPLFAARASRALCLGVLFAGIIQVCAALRSALAATPPRACSSLGRAFSPSGRNTLFNAAAGLLRGPAPPDAAALLRALPRNIAGAAPHVLHLIAGTVLASFLVEGGVSALYFAERLVELPLGLFGATLGLATLPGLAAMAESGEYGPFSQSLGQSIRLTLFFSLPATAGLFALSQPLCALLFGHGAYDARGVALTAAVLSGSCFSLPALCASRPLLSAASAMGAGAATVRAAWMSLVPLILIGAAGLSFFGGETCAAAFCIGVGLTAGAWTNAALLLRLLGGRGVPPPLAGQTGALCAYLTAAACLGAALLALNAHAEPWPPQRLLLAVALCAGLWGGGALLAGNEDARRIWRGMRKKP